MGDNGTPNSKGLYQGGIHVPLVFSGHGVDRMGEEEDALITAVDLYNTFLEAAGLTGRFRRKAFGRWFPLQERK